ncbi:probable LRR receptor-like serine/threonine-protein kinase At1g56130 [Selaginella moellendorffii]|uniref:probable LRR receptor-like serine/threonine-protein kinase At1g56130 n=1 Tax=Selaginella moellendorffii TaxID=88036 RepID=UPI000D1C95E4|nr:probable LRR receptor-like serine/threonine-protein kinase At1g56130 [Selaginella moellendorffii]|eukprot:XP_024520234.1 probable LRR receptor-like serine/threonine-protein kinase At1g56130 [Selaginella moellendorffii]
MIYGREGNIGLEMSCLWWVLLLILCFGTRPLAAQQQRPVDVTDPGQLPNVLYYNTANTSEGSPFQRNLDTVFEFLQGFNPSNGFATSLGYGAFPNIAYAHTACYNMSDQPSCSSCIQQTYANVRTRFPIGARFWRNSTAQRCNMRFENSNFTRDLPSGTLGILGPNASAPAPPPVVPPPTPASTPGGGSGGSGNTAAIVAGVVVPVFLILGVAGLLLVKRRRSRRRRRRRRRRGGLPRVPSSELQRSSRGPIAFSYRDLCEATEDFSDRNKLGQGGFGTVYKAFFGDGTVFAVKRLSVESQQGKREFVNEIDIITGIRHKNLVMLEGYCCEGNHRLIVYEFLEKGSLDQTLFGKSLLLDWPARFQIIVGVAKGLAYLHEESHEQVIHRDIKASNILLDKMLQPKISDFGISKLAGVDRENTTTRLAGTVGYMAPEYVLRGRLSSKADVFSFGVLVLEIISGRKCMDDTLPVEEEILAQWAWSLFGAGKLEELIDPRLEKFYIAEEAHRATHVALLCSREFEGSRPTMSAVVAMLMGYLELEPLTTVDTPNYFGQIRHHGWTTTTTTTTSQTGSSYAASPLTATSAR